MTSHAHRTTEGSELKHTALASDASECPNAYGRAAVEVIEDAALAATK
jgi:hypothetical protein